MRTLLLLGIGAVLTLGCGGESQEVESAAEAPAEDREVATVFVVNYPLQYFAQRIGGDQAEVSFPAPANVDPAYWQPLPEVVADYQEADLILLNGADYAQWVDLVSLPQAKLVDTSAAFSDRYVPLEEGPVHSHGPEGEHSHTGYASTTWLDVGLAIEQARAIAAALSSAAPQHRASFEERFAALEADLNELDRRMEAVAAKLSGELVVFSHPVYQYLERRYEIEGHSLHWEPDAAPDEEMWSELESRLEKQPARWMIWEDQPLGPTRDRLAELGVESLVLRPLAQAPTSGDFLTEMSTDLAAVETALASD